MCIYYCVLVEFVLFLFRWTCFVFFAACVYFFPDSDMYIYFFSFHHRQPLFSQCTFFGSFTLSFYNFIFCCCFSFFEFSSVVVYKPSSFLKCSDAHAPYVQSSSLFCMRAFFRFVFPQSFKEFAFFSVNCWKLFNFYTLRQVFVMCLFYFSFVSFLFTWLLLRWFSCTYVYCLYSIELVWRNAWLNMPSHFSRCFFSIPYEKKWFFYLRCFLRWLTLCRWTKSRAKQVIFWCYCRLPRARRDNVFVFNSRFFFFCSVVTLIEITWKHDF